MPTSSIPSGGGGGLEPKYQKFTSSGTFTLPDGYGAAKPLLVTIQVIGGGGGGGAQFIYGTGTANINWSNYFGDNRTVAFSNANTSPAQPGSGGGSGGLCATQLYLTSNLTITCGAAGARAAGAGTTVNINTGNYGSPYSTNPAGSMGTYTGRTGGTGGTTTASVLQATGGVGGSGPDNLQMYQDGNWAHQGISNGGGGTPAGTTGMATPLLGTLAGGSSSSTPIRGSFGVGGISTDTTTATGAEGTGGGFNSIGAPGAVILTWWQ